MGEARFVRACKGLEALVADMMMGRTLQSIVDGRICSSSSGWVHEVS